MSESIATFGTMKRCHGPMPSGSGLYSIIEYVSPSVFELDDRLRNIDGDVEPLLSSESRFGLPPLELLDLRNESEELDLSLSNCSRDVCFGVACGCTRTVGVFVTLSNSIVPDAPNCREPLAAAINMLCRFFFSDAEPLMPSASVDDSSLSQERRASKKFSIGARGAGAGSNVVRSVLNTNCRGEHGNDCERGNVASTFLPCVSFCSTLFPLLTSR